jgi:hypothetical protein
LVLFYLKLLPSGPFLPVVWVMLVTVGVYLSLHAVFTARSGELTWTLPGGVINRYLWLYGALFILSLDFWAWGKAQPLFFGVPYWISYFLVLSLLQTIAMVLMLNGQDALYTEGVEPGQVPDGAHP